MYYQITHENIRLNPFRHRAIFQEYIEGTTKEDALEKLKTTTNYEKPIQVVSIQEIPLEVYKKGVNVFVNPLLEQGIEQAMKQM